MVLQVYRNEQTKTILICNKTHISKDWKSQGYEMLEEVEGADWHECNKQITKKYFSETYQD